jgi:hypothetical protein
MHRLGDGWLEHVGIEVCAHTLDNFAIEERIRLGLAAQLMPFLLAWRLVPSGSFLVAS